MSFRVGGYIFHSLSFLFNDFFDSVAHGQDSSVHQINRYWSQRILDFSIKGAKITFGFLSIQSILTQPQLDNMKDLVIRYSSDFIHSSDFIWNVNFLSVNLIPGRSDLHIVLWRISICYVICSWNVANIDLVAFCLSERLNKNLYYTLEKLIFSVYIYIFLVHPFFFLSQKKNSSDASTREKKANFLIARFFLFMKVLSLANV